MMTYQEWREEQWRNGVTLPDFRELMEKWERGYSYDTSGTIEEFSRTYDVPRRSIHNWLSGSRKPPEYLLWLVAYALYTDDFKPPSGR